MSRNGRLILHRQALLACRRCGLADGIAPIISSAGPSRVMLVGQAPGRVEGAGGKPFAGRAGATLFRWLERAGVDEETARARIYITAITRCFPGPSASGRGDRVPSQVEQNECAVWLEAELEIIRPTVLVPVGRLAIARFLPNLALDRLIGREHTVEYAGRHTTVIPLPHPSGASSWIHQADHPKLLDRALKLLAGHLQELGIGTGFVKRGAA